MTTQAHRRLLILTAGLAFLLAPAPRAADVTEEAPPTPGVAAVRFRDEPIFDVRVTIAGVPIAERAKVIERRLERIAGGDAARQPVRVEDREKSSDIYVGDAFVMSVLDGDASPVGLTRQRMAADNARKLAAAMGQEAEARTPRALLRSALKALAATAALVLVIVLLRLALRRLEGHFESWKGRWLRPLRVQRVEFLSAEREVKLIRTAARLLWLALSLAALVAWADVVLQSFPWTRGLGRRILMFGWGVVRHVVSAVVDYLPNLVYIIVFVLVGRWAIHLVRLVFREVERGTVVLPGFDREWADTTAKIVAFFIVAVVGIAAFPYLPGAGSTAFQAISVFIGVVLSFGSSSAVSNVVAGVVLTYMRPFRLGDRIQVGDTVGDVVEKGLLVTRVRTIRSVEVTIPSGMVLANHIVNYSACTRGDGLAVHATVTIGYDVPWRQVHDLLLAAARKTESILAKPAPFVMQTALDDFYVRYEIDAYTGDANRMHLTQSALNQAIQDTFFEAGVEICSPHFAAVRDGNEAAIPEAQRPKGAVRAFRVSQVDPGKGG